MIGIRRETYMLVRIIVAFGIALQVSLATLQKAEAGNSERPKRVLLISSYHPSFPTFFQQISGIKQGFRDGGFNVTNLILDIEFMDSKRFPDKEHAARFRDSLSFKLTGKPAFDVVMIADDNALVFGLKNHSSLLKNSPLVFLGINNQTLADELNVNPLVTGVVEAISMAETLRAIENLTPASNELYIVAAADQSSRLNIELFERQKKILKRLSGQILSLDKSDLWRFG